MCSYDVQQSACVCVDTGRVTHKYVPVPYCSYLCLIFDPGGLVCRGILERYSNNVKTFVSLSSPQAGQYGGKVDAL